jgi:hypothetical protein
VQASFHAATRHYRSRFVDKHLIPKGGALQQTAALHDDRGHACTPITPHQDDRVCQL